MSVSDAHRFRKTVAGLCMIGAPVLFLVASVVAPGLSSDEAAMARMIAEDSGAWASTQVLSLVGWALFLTAVLGVMHMLRERGAAEGHLGGGLAMLGAIAAIGQCGFGLALWQVAKTDQGQATSLLSAFADASIPAIVLFILPLAVTVGAVVLAWALARHRFVPVWMAVAIGAAGILFAVAALTFSQGLYIAASVVLLAGFGGLGWMVLGESVEDWEHTPQFRGMRTAAGAQ